ncbi:MUC17 isoform 2 [Pongo abelii]|uniref:MUC17 isoform 2 n=1 Tax=Pongo abelii TaxID=9601 RepID=A0A2J8XUB6_PONAB|nr:MUC17 isoform 2 [Pongo abelii]
MPRPGTMALCLLTLVLSLLPPQAAAEQDLSMNRAVWDGGGCSSQGDLWNPQCQQLSQHIRIGSAANTATASTLSTTPADTSTPVTTSTEASSSPPTAEGTGMPISTPSEGSTPLTSFGDQCQTTASRCKNGGTLDGLKCQCPNLYYGELCEEVVSSIDIGPPETISAQMELTVTVTSVSFTEELKNRSSQQFQEFNQTFTEQMNIVYSGIPEYVGVNITNLRYNVFQHHWHPSAKHYGDAVRP